MVGSKQSVVVAGGANVDILGRSADSLVDHDSNPGSVQIVAGGVARNIAENLARLGVDTQLVSAIGDDEHGRIVRQSCRDAGIGIDYLRQDDTLPTSVYAAIVDSGGELRVAVSDMALIERLGNAELEACRHLFARATLVVVDTNLGADALAAIAAARSAPLFVDTVSTAKAGRIRPCLAAVDTLKTSRLEAGAVSGIAATDEAGCRANAAWFHDKGVGSLFITLGEEGVFYSSETASAILRPKTGCNPVVNAGGAGDAFLAGLAYARLENLDLQSAIEFALAAARITAGHPGTNNPALTREMITAAQEK